MKKTLLSLVALAMMAGSADAKMYLVGDPAGKWSPQVGIEMEEADGGYKWTGAVGADQWFAFATELLDSDDWNTFNSTYRLNPAINGTVAADGEYALELGGKDRSFKGTGTEVTYIIKENAGAYSLSVIGGGEAPDPVEQTWSVVGAFNGWGEEPDFQMTKIRDGVWKATMYDFSGEFKLRANNSWDVNFGAEAEDVVVIEGDGDFALATDGKNFNIPEVVEEVILYLDVNNMTLTVDGLTPSMLALRGNFIDWAFEWSYLFMEVEDDVYMLYLDGMDADWKFKIADQDWKEIYTTSVTNMAAGEIYPIDPDNAADMGIDGTYTDVTMWLNVDDGYITFYGEMSGVEAINEIASGAARYFNLQGVEIANPTNGIFVRVRNGKSEKITVK